MGRKKLSIFTTSVMNVPLFRPSDFRCSLFCFLSISAGATGALVSKKFAGETKGWPEDKKHESGNLFIPAE